VPTVREAAFDLPALDCAAVASAYGVSSRRAFGRDELGDALAESIAAEEPRLVEVPVTPGMALL
jgi:thiamine pyrophosphate-dependent acetolactate synthase large subunit-like protein